MAFRDIVTAAKKPAVYRAPPTPLPSNTANIIDAEAQVEALQEKAHDGETVVPHVEKKDISYKDSEITGFVPKPRTASRNAQVSSAHGSIIRNIAAESDRSSQLGATTSWQECTHRKEGFGRDYCKEYHSICYKEKCSRARK